MIRTILHYPDPRLRKVATRVAIFTSDLERLVSDMVDTMYTVAGVGLAAPQIGESVAVFVIDTGEEGLRTFVNPEIVSTSNTMLARTEGCLSFPGISEPIERADAITIKAFDTQGKSFQFVAYGFLAVAIQHEFDHLEGKLMIDHMGQLRKRMVHRRMLARSRL